MTTTTFDLSTAEGVIHAMSIWRAGINQIPMSLEEAQAIIDARCCRTPHPGTVYLLHFDRPYKHAAHYTGWSLNLTHRLETHRAGKGARLLEVIQAEGIGWQLARTWTGTRHLERALKRQGGASRRCPLCGINPRTLPTNGDGHDHHS